MGWTSKDVEKARLRIEGTDKVDVKKGLQTTSSVDVRLSTGFVEKEWQFDLRKSPSRQDSGIDYELAFYQGVKLDDFFMEKLGFQWLPCEIMGAVRTTKYISVMPMAKLSEANKVAKARWMKYCDLKDAYREKWGGVDATRLEFVAEFAMPTSWSKKNREEHMNKLHDQKPDVDNIAKGILDACMKEDKKVGIVFGIKRWSDRDGVWVRWIK